MNGPIFSHKTGKKTLGESLLPLFSIMRTRISVNMCKRGGKRVIYHFLAFKFFDCLLWVCGKNYVRYPWLKLWHWHPHTWCLACMWVNIKEKRNTPWCLACVSVNKKEPNTFCISQKNNIRHELLHYKTNTCFEEVKYVGFQVILCTWKEVEGQNTK